MTAGALLPPQAGSSPRCCSLQSAPKGFRSLGGGEQHRGAATQLPAQPPCLHLLGGRASRQDTSPRCLLEGVQAFLAAALGLDTPPVPPALQVGG